MKWVKSRSDFRHPKIYASTPENKQEFIFPKWLGWLLAILIFAGAAYWFLFYSDYFKIKNIEITGTLNPSVNNEIESFKGKSIINLFIGNLSDDLTKKYSSIKSINIKRGIPDTLRINVEVRKPQILWKTNDRSYYVDDYGMVFSMPSEDDLKDEDRNYLITITDTQSVPVVEGTQIMTPGLINFVKDLKSKFEAKSGAKITELRIGESMFQIEVRTDKNFYVLFDTTRGLDPQLNALEKIIKEHLSDVTEYIDLRVEGKVYAK